MSSQWAPAPSRRAACSPRSHRQLFRYGRSWCRLLWLVWSRAGRGSLRVHGDAGRHGDPGQLRLYPNMSVDREPVRIVKRSRHDASHPWTDLRGMQHGRSAIRAETHAQPAATFVGAMLALRQFPLDNLDRLLIKGRNDREGTGESALTEFAVADGREDGFAKNTVANRATCAAA